MGKTVVKEYAIPAGDSLKIFIPGDYFLLLETAAPVNIDVLKKNSRVGKIINVDNPFGYGRARDGFDGLSIESYAGGAQTIKLAISDDPIVYNKLSGTVTVDKATGLSTTPDVALDAGAQTLISAVNANRRTAIITNLSGNVSTIRVGDSSAAAARGTPIAPGMSGTFDTTAALYAWNPGAIQSVALTEVED